MAWPMTLGMGSATGAAVNPRSEILPLALIGVAIYVFYKLHHNSVTGSGGSGGSGGGYTPYSANDPYLPGNYVPGEPTNFYNPSSDPGVVVPGGKLLL